MLQAYVLHLLQTILYSNDWSEEIKEALENDMQYVVEGDYNNHPVDALQFIWANWEDNMWKGEEEYQVYKWLDQAMKDLHC